MHSAPIAIVVVAIAVVVPVLGLVTALTIVAAKRGVLGGASSGPPGPMTYAEASRPLGDNLSLADKRELLSRVNGQRVRWSCSFVEAWTRRGTLSALVQADGGGQVFFDPGRRDRGRIEQMTRGMPLVVEGTVRVDIEHGLVNLEAPVLVG
jgi:hypothetical protein